MALVYHPSIGDGVSRDSRTRERGLQGIPGGHLKCDIVGRLSRAAIAAWSICAAFAPTHSAQAAQTAQTAAAPAGPRARDLGVPFDGTPGPLNAITDVAGVLVGHTTLISGSGKLKVGEGPVRTGVTAVLPRGRDSMSDPVFAAWFAQNGNGEMTGTTWVEESGFLEGPVMITNTHSVGVVRDATIKWRVAARRRRCHRLLVVAAGGRRNLGRLVERHQRISRQAGARVSRARHRARRAQWRKAASAGAPA